MPVLITDDAPLRALNAFGISARARRLIELAAPEDVAAALDACRGLRPLLLGGGSNLLFVGDVDAPVLRIGLRGRRILSDDGEQVLVEAAAGEPWHEFVVWTLAQGLAGLQNLALIPGTVGAAPMQNIGAYGVELSDSFRSLTAVHVASGRWRDFDANDCRFAYRDSYFKTPAGREWVIVSVRLRLARQASLALDYGELRAELR
ncbi:MAG TPA: FAD-binding protein, partial [Burkholderiaceae bacterium]|nr:FAD-binding protein [Burkholderiaceae bacterium]